MKLKKELNHYNKNYDYNYNYDLNNLWALIPAYNEEKTIKELIIRTKKILNNILVVNDGSTDNTKEILKEIKNIEVININNNSGKANALLKGINYLKNKKVKQIITFDADLQHLPEEIPNFLNQNADMVLGVRKNKQQMPFFRKIGNKIASKVISLKTGLTINDPQSGFRLFSKKAINELDFKGNNFNIEKKLILQASKKKLNIKEVPISCIYKKNGRKSYLTIKDLIDFFKN